MRSRLTLALLLLAGLAWFGAKSRSDAARGAPDAPLEPRAAPSTADAQQQTPRLAGVLEDSRRRPSTTAGKDTDWFAEATDRAGARSEEPEPPIEEYEEVEEEYDVAEYLARAGLDADTPLALMIDRFGPPDPIETGDAKLHLQLLDLDTGEPVASPVVLWQVGARSNVYWTRGDQALMQRNVPSKGTTFTGLAGGEYRVQCRALRRGAPDPPAFFVSGETKHTLRLDLPESRPVRLVARRGGKNLSRIDVYMRSIRHHPANQTPRWAKQRELVDPPDAFIEEFTSYDGDPSMGANSWQTLTAGVDGFDLGHLPGDRQDGRYTRQVDLRTEGGAETSLLIANERAGDVIRVIHDFDD